MIGGERQGLVAAVGVWLAAVAAFWIGVDDPWWAAISAWVVANPDRQALTLKSGMRLAGTFAGGVLGYQLALLIEGQAVLQALVLFAAGTVGTLMRFRSRFGYAWLLGTITISMAVIGSIQDPATLHAFVVFRCTEIGVGVLAALAAALVLGRDVHGPPAAPATPAPSRLEEWHAALIGGLMPVAILLAWSAFDLPSLLQIVVSAVVVIDRDVAVMRVKGLQRILGCLLGGVTGLLFAAGGFTGFFPWSVVFIGGMLALAHLHHGRGAHTYVGTQGGFAFILAMVTGPGPPDTIEPVVQRLAGMLCGVVLLLVVVAVARPFLEWLVPKLPAAAGGRG
jgi:uncharacterized membrane protein YccC